MSPDVLEAEVDAAAALSEVRHQRTFAGDPAAFDDPDRLAEVISDRLGELVYDVGLTTDQRIAIIEVDYLVCRLVRLHVESRTASN